MGNLKHASRIAVILAIGALGFVALQPWSLVNGGGLFKPNDRDIVTRGAKIYAESCASCHGVNLEGQPNWRRPGPDGLLPAPPHDETGHTWHHDDQTLFGITKLGLAEFAGLKDYKTNMPVYRDILTDDEIIAVLSYIKAQWPAEMQERHDQLNAPSSSGSPQ